MKTKIHKKAFTLLELMIVISLIAILIGLLYAGVKGAITATKRATDRNSVAAIANACRQYMATYGSIPNTGTVPANLIVNTGTLFVNCMTGIDTNLNPRRIQFMEIRRSALFPSGGGSIMLDAFRGGATFVYRIVWDLNQDGIVGSVGDTGTLAGDNVRAPVAVYGVGTNRVDELGAGDDITSWK